MLIDYLAAAIILWLLCWLIFFYAIDYNHPIKKHQTTQYRIKTQWGNPILLSRPCQPAGDTAVAVYGFTAVATANLAVFDHPSRRLAARDVVCRQCRDGETRLRVSVCRMGFVWESTGQCTRCHNCLWAMPKLPMADCQYPPRSLSNSHTHRGAWRVA